MERYQIIQEAAGEGGFGRIDKAHDGILDRYLAIKTLDPLFKEKATPSDIDRFRREAQTLAKLSHPNIPSIFDITLDEDLGEFRILFEWIEGPTLAEYIKSEGPLNLEDARRYFRHVCSALDHIHSRGVIHRDLKPANLILSNGVCFVVDFGISLSAGDLHRLTQSTSIGTPGYMSPEQQNGEELGPSADVWSLAVVLYECLSGQRPTAGEYRPLNSYNEGIPPAIDDLIRDSLKDAKARTPSVADFQKRLDSALTPRSTLQKILTEGALHEIQLALSELQPLAYAQLPPGQRILIMSRLRDLIDADHYPLRKPVAAFLEILLRVAFSANGTDYSYIARQALHYGYEKRYSEEWMGDQHLRETINVRASESNHEAHALITAEILSFFQDIELSERDKWYHHDLRILYQNLLANEHCSESHAIELGDQLRKLNALRN